MTSAVDITFQTPEGQETTLSWALYPHSLSRRWRSLIAENQRQGHDIHTYFHNHSINSLPRLVAELDHCIARVNQSYDLSIDRAAATQAAMNSLHEQFEHYGQRLDRGEHIDPNSSLVWSEVLHNSWLRINELVHSIEIVLGSDHSDSMSVVIDYWPQGLHQALEPLDRLYATPVTRWGGLYLGYNTLGKDWIEAQQHNDLDLVQRGLVQAQQRFAAELWANFGPDDYDLYGLTAFEQWVDSLEPELRASVPTDNLSKLALGRPQLGQLLIRGDLLVYHPRASDWFVPNHRVKQEWNREVFSQFTAVTAITLTAVDIDQYWQSLTLV